MHIHIIAVGSKMPDWINAGFETYKHRLQHPMQLQLTEIPLKKRHKNADVKRMIAQEGEQMLANIRKDSRVIALEVQGKSWSTQQLANELTQIQDNGEHISLLIGGPEGLAPACLQRADCKWSLSPLTLAHPLVRLVVVEAIYRAWTIMIGHPYHRE